MWVCDHVCVHLSELPEEIQGGHLIPQFWSYNWALAVAQDLLWIGGQPGLESKILSQKRTANASIASVFICQCLSEGNVL